MLIPLCIQDDTKAARRRRRRRTKQYIEKPTMQPTQVALECEMESDLRIVA